MKCRSASVGLNVIHSVPLCSAGNQTHQLNAPVQMATAHLLMGDSASSGDYDTFLRKLAAKLSVLVPPPPFLTGGLVPRYAGTVIDEASSF